jgi:DNA gyrase subunit B
MEIPLSKTKAYDASSIDVHLGLDGVRQNSNVYIGEPNSDGIFKCWQEVFDNSKDEFTDGHGKTISVVIESSNEFWIIDEARGLPIDIHPKTNLSVLETVLTTLSAGGKMRKTGSSYNKATWGVHGMGVSVSNALSSEMQVWTYRDNNWHTQIFRKGKPVSKLAKCKAPKPPFLSKFSKKAGTAIKFTPDKSIFEEGSRLSTSKVKEFLDLASYINKGMRIVYASSKGETVYHQPKGLTAYLEKLVTKTEAEIWNKPFNFENSEITLAMQWTKNDTEYLNSLVNSGNVKEGGTHITGLNKAIMEAVAPFAPKKANYKIEDIKAGLVTIINVEVKTPKFATQTKDRLITPEVANIVYEAVLEPLKDYFSKNKGFGKALVKRATELAKINSQAAMDKKAKASFKSKKTRAGIPAKLSPCLTKDRSKAELFLVEGDSAAGSAVKARDSQIHAILRLRGKGLNVYGTKGTASKIFANEEIKSLLTTLGYNPDKPNDFKFNYGKIIIMADEDPDGAHISSLLLSTLNRLIPQAFEQGMVYILQGSLYTCNHKGKQVFADSRKDLLKITNGKISKDGMTRLKGWGEAQPKWLETLAFDADTRKLIKIMPSSKEKTKKYITLVSSGPESIEARCKIMGI